MQQECKKKQQEQKQQQDTKEAWKLIWKVAVLRSMREAVGITVEGYIARVREGV